MDKIKTGELIKNKRIEKGYTQLELGDLLGVSNKAVSRWENGDSFLSCTIYRLRVFLDGSVISVVPARKVQTRFS